MAKKKNIRVAAKSFSIIPAEALVPYANNAREHSKAQIDQLRKSLREFGFVTPILIDDKLNVIAGHGRLEAAKAEGMTSVPCVLVGDLPEAQRRAYILADNRLAETATWNESMLQIELAALQELSFDANIVGFDVETVEEISVAGHTRIKSNGKSISESEKDIHEQAPPSQSEPEQTHKHDDVCTCPNCGHHFKPN